MTYLEDFVPSSNGSECSRALLIIDSLLILRSQIAISSFGTLLEAHIVRVSTVLYELIAYLSA